MQALGVLEEREVRVVAVLASDEFIKLGEPDAPPQKEVKSFDRNEEKVPYIELFSTLAAGDTFVRLPIKRVIVGPHKKRVQHAEFVRELLAQGGYDVEVVQSEIPYIGR